MKKKYVFDFSGTRRYTLQGSNDATNWTPLADGTLPDPRGIISNCAVPIVEVSVGRQNFQHVLFTAVDYYGSGAGLMYMATSG